MGVGVSSDKPLMRKEVLLGKFILKKFFIEAGHILIINDRIYM